MPNQRRKNLKETVAQTPGKGVFSTLRQKDSCLGLLQEAKLLLKACQNLFMKWIFPLEFPFWSKLGLGGSLKKP